MIAVAFRVAHASWTAQRRVLLAQLRQRLGPVNRPHSFKVIEDHTRAGCWPTVRRAWIDGVLDQQATHVHAMQDDIHPCPRFIEALEKILAMRPNDPIAFWTRRPLADRITDSAWMRTQAGGAGGGLVMPKEMTKDFIRWHDRFIPQQSDVLYAEDSRMAWYFVSNGITLYFVLPSLMNHYGVKSLLGHDSINRGLMKPKRFIGLDGDPLTVDWTEGFDDPPWSPKIGPAQALKTLSPRVIMESGLGQGFPTLGQWAQQQGVGHGEAQPS